MRTPHDEIEVLNFVRPTLVRAIERLFVHAKGPAPISNVGAADYTKSQAELKGYGHPLQWFQSLCREKGLELELPELVRFFHGMNSEVVEKELGRMTEILYEALRPIVEEDVREGLANKIGFERQKQQTLEELEKRAESARLGG